MNQTNVTSQRDKNSYTRNEILNTINEKSNFKQQINHRKRWEEAHYSREIRNQSDINIGMASLFLIYFLNLLKGVDFISFPRELHTFGP